MESSREKEFLRLLSEFLDCDDLDKQDLTVEDYFDLFSIELNILDTFNEREVNEIGNRLLAEIEMRISKMKGLKPPSEIDDDSSS